MASNTLKNLEQAKAYFYSLRLVEAYNILRRYFDRLPFQPEPEHAEYIGMFARTLSELGKEYDLNFYLGELERLFEKMKSPEIAYQLSVVYLYLPEPRVEASKKLLDFVLKDPTAKSLHAKAKMMYADYYHSTQNDLGMCRMLIDSIGKVEDPHLQVLVDIWRAIILKDEGNLNEAEAVINKILAGVCKESNWYAYFSARVIQALTLIKMEKREAALGVIHEVRAMFQGRACKSAMIQIQALESKLADDTKLNTLLLREKKGTLTISYENKSLTLDEKSPGDKLLLQLAKRGYLEKAFIVKSLYSRDYDAQRDDKVVYYQIHSLRKRLKTLGLPGDAVMRENGGYRLVPEVKFLEGDI